MGSRTRVESPTHCDPIDVLGDVVSDTIEHEGRDILYPSCAGWPGHHTHLLGWLVERSISPPPHRGQTMYRFPYCLDFFLSMRLCRICPFHPHSREMQYTNCRTAGRVAERRIVETMTVSLMPYHLSGAGGDNRCRRRRPLLRPQSQIYVYLIL